MRKSVSAKAGPALWSPGENRGPRIFSKLENMLAMLERVEG